MRRFLRETWELWYWAMFCPSKLQQRMNEWAPAEEKKGHKPNTKFSYILLARANHRFVVQYVLLILGFSLPLAWKMLFHGQPLDWLLLPVVLVIAYGIGIWFLSLGLLVPLIWGLVYIERPETWGKGLNPVFNILPLAGGFAAGTLFLITTILLCLRLLKSNVADEVANGVVGGAAGGVAFFVGSAVFFVGNQASIIVGLLAGSMAFLVAISVADDVLRKSLRFNVGEGVGFTVGFAVGFVVGFVAGFAVAYGVALGVVFGLVFGVGGVATLSLPLFMLVCCLVAVSLSLAQNKWLAIFAAGILAVLVFRHPERKALLAIPVALVSYYRLPDYLILTSISLLSSISLVIRFHGKPLQLLSWLPPHTTELLWLPLPAHDRILTAAFRTDASAALVTFQQMQASPLPGFNHTIRQALPQIVADQLAAVDTISKLLLTAQDQHPLLPLLVPTFYQQGTELQEQPRSLGMLESLRIENSLLSQLLIKPVITVFPAGILLISVLDDLEDGTDIKILLPRLQAVVRDVNAALEAGNTALRERGLERILNNLGMLQAQLPGLGLKAPAIKRWEPVIKRWQQVIQLELEEQQKQSQGEQLNPFQYGNPLRRDRAYLFKGRQAFADNIVRLILDRNRPTLVLHGPRRFGKSSFLLNLPRLLPSDMLPIYLDMQSAAVTTDEAAFCQGIVRAISKDSRSQGVELPAIPQRKEFLDTPYIALEDWLEQAVPKLGDRRLLLNLDEFEKIGSAINEGRMSLNLFNELRHLIQHYDQLGFLFSGVQTLDELGPNWSSYFISVVPIEMLYLKPHEAEDLLVNPDPEFTLRYDTGIVEDILTLTRCQPYLLQLIGSSLVKLANENHTQLVTSDLLQASIPEAFTNGQPYFTNVWTEFTGTSPTEVKAGQELLLALAQGHQPSSVASDETAQAARQRLLRYHVIEHINGSDRFEIPLIERWVRERAIRN